MINTAVEIGHMFQLKMIISVGFVWVHLGQQLDEVD
jgi:hypothetical protein